MMINEQLYNDSSSVSRPLIQVINEIILIFKYAPWILKFNMEAQKQGVEAWNMIFLLDSNPMWKAHAKSNNQQPNQQPTTTTNNNNNNNNNNNTSSSSSSSNSNSNSNNNNNNNSNNNNDIPFSSY